MLRAYRGTLTYRGVSHMGTVKLIAKTAFPYDGRSLQSGDLFEAVSERDAHILRLGGKADYAPRLRKHPSRKDLTPETPDQESGDQPKRQYHRRDLVPEP